MDQKDTVFLLLLLLLLFQVLLVAAESKDFTALVGLTEGWGNKPPSWVAIDPCKWDGIYCTKSRVTSISISSTNMTGSLSSEIQSLFELRHLHLTSNKGLTGNIPEEIGNLTKLKILILGGCDFFGTIPDAIGSLKKLNFLGLNGNRFSGRIPRTIGNLANVDWLDLSDNQLEGPIPVLDDRGPGLDMLHKAKHFHFGDNNLSGEIPAQLFHANMSLLHALFYSNQLNGSIPSTLTLVRTLEVVRFDRNQLSGQVPKNINSLIHLMHLCLSNNNLNGSLPDLTGLDHLTYVDLSNNTFNSSDIPSWASSLPSLTTLKLESTGLEGPIPVSLFDQFNLESVELRDNKLSGILDIGSAYSRRLQFIDLVNNSVTDFRQKNMENNVTVILDKNPVCLQAATSPRSYCKDPQISSWYSTPSNNCSPLLCSTNQNSSPTCKCAFPYTGNLSSRALGFSNFENSTYYLVIQQTLLETFQSQNLPVDSVSLSDPLQTSVDFQLTLKLFPSQSDRFNRTGLWSISFVLSNQIYNAPEFFNPYSFNGHDYNYYADEPARSKSNNTGLIVGAVVGILVILALSLVAGIYAIHQKKRVEKAIEIYPLVKWKLNKRRGTPPQVKTPRWFSFEELKRYTNNFSEATAIGIGGFGKVYLGVLPTGEWVAIKRAGHTVLGDVEFKNEIELLSRVHHKNLVDLLGLCFEEEEQILVYEYISNGTLRDSLSGKSGIRMDWMRRLKVALGAARGLAYLHDHADPAIIHRDIKSTNILLDDHLNAKVADFGISKLLVGSERDYVISDVKGTMGYLDPECMNGKLTKKSDVYSFGVVMLDLVTAKRAVEEGISIISTVKNVMDRSKDLYNLQLIIDPIIMEVTIPNGLEKFVDLALKCVNMYSDERPAMAEVVKEIEKIMELAGFNPNAESATTSESHEEASGSNIYHPYDNEDFN